MKYLQLIISIFIISWLITDKASSQVPPVKIDLTSAGNKLNADIYVSQGNQRKPSLILMQGYPGYEGDLFGLGKSLSSSGINVLIFNFQSSWSSGGTFGYESSLHDIGNAIKFLKQEENIEKYNIDTTNIIVSGYSYGGGIALTFALYNKNVKKIISIAGANFSSMGRKWMTDSTYRIPLESYFRSTIFPQGPIKGDFDSIIDNWLSNLDYYDLVKHAENIKEKDILLIGGWYDTTNSVDEVIIPLYRKLHNLNAKSVKIKVFDTDHSFKNVTEELTETIQNWINNNKRATTLHIK